MYRRLWRYQTVAYIGLVVAFLSLAVALGAWRVSHTSLAIAREEHRIFLKQIRARADFDIEIYVADYPDGIIETSKPEVHIKWQVGMSNSGEIAAEMVGVNFLMPKWVEDPCSVTQGNMRMPDPHQTQGPTTTAEELTDSDGRKRRLTTSSKRLTA